MLLHIFLSTLVPPESRFWAMVDVDGDGLISYEEFMLFRTLIAIPKRKVTGRSLVHPVGGR